MDYLHYVDESCAWIFDLTPGAKDSLVNYSVTKECHSGRSY